MIGAYTQPDNDTAQEDVAGRAWDRIAPEPSWLDDVVMTTRPATHPDELAALGDLGAGAARRPFTFATELAKPLFRWCEDGVPPIDGRVVQIAEGSGATKGLARRSTW